MFVANIHTKGCSKLYGKSKLSIRSYLIKKCTEVLLKMLFARREHYRKVKNLFKSNSNYFRMLLFCSFYENGNCIYRRMETFPHWLHNSSFCNLCEKSSESIQTSTKIPQLRCIEVHGSRRFLENRREKLQ